MKIFTVIFAALLLFCVLYGCQGGKEPTASYGPVSWSIQTFTFDLNQALNNPALEDSLDPSFSENVGSLENVVSVHVCGSLADGFGLQPQDTVMIWTPDSSNRMVEIFPGVYQFTINLYTGLWFYKFCVITQDGEAWTRDPVNPNHSNYWGNSELVK